MSTNVSSRANRSSDWRVYRESNLPPILGAALKCFVQQGFHGTSIRTVAVQANLSVPGLYHHYASKQALLTGICDHAMDDLWERSLAALDEAGESVPLQLDLLVECLVLYHAHRRDPAFIAASEIRSLVGEARTNLIASRDRLQRLMDHVVAEGVAQGAFSTALPLESSRALVTMCTGVAQWFRLQGPLTADELARDYTSIARMTVGCKQ